MSTRKEATLRKVSNLLEKKEVYGIYYKNNFFSRRYLARTVNKTDKVRIDKNRITIPFDMRVEEAGLFELEETFYWLVQTNTGDFPDKTEEQIADILSGNVVPEPISATVSLVSMDTLLRFDDPVVEVQTFKINGNTLDLVYLYKDIEVENESGETDTFQQFVTLLFGEKGKLSPFSFMVTQEKPLSRSDSVKVLDLLAGDNVTGCAITAVREVSRNEKIKLTRAMYPADRLIGFNYNRQDYFVLQGEAGITVLPPDCIENMDVTFVDGSYHIIIHTTQGTDIILYME